MHEKKDARSSACEAAASESGHGPASADLRQLCASLAEIGAKLDRLEDAVHDLSQVLARSVGPPWDITGN
jgi:hypothetical protein